MDMFASSTLAGHLVRGAVGIGAIWLAVVFSASLWLSLALGVIALLAFRGCPMCWTIGLVETVRTRLRA